MRRSRSCSKPASPLRSQDGPQLAAVGQDDAADLTLILELLHSFRRHEQTQGRIGLKVLREAVFFHWEGPRLPPGHKRSHELLHSPAAREQRKSGDETGLVYEHVRPISLVLRSLLEHVPDDAEGLRQTLMQGPEPVIITKAEDSALDEAGVKNSIPNEGDPWSRYRSAGLDPDTFAPYTRMTTPGR